MLPPPNKYICAVCKKQRETYYNVSKKKKRYCSASCAFGFTESPKTAADHKRPIN